MFKNLIRFAVMLAAVVVSTDAFAQTATRNRPNLFNRNRPGAQNNTQAAAAETPKTENKDVPTFNWDATPVDIVLQAYAERVDKTYLKDPAVPNATISLKSREGQKMTQEEYLEAIEVVLEMNGIHIEPYGEKFLRVLPRKEVRKEGIPIIMDQETKLTDSGKVVSMMVQLRNISTEDGQKTLDNFKSGMGIIIAFERTNSLLITDTEQNINRMLEIVRSIDIAMPVLENVFVRQIKNASAADIKTALEAIVQESQKELEKSGKGANIASQNNAMANRPNQRPGVLGRQQNQPAAPVNNSSVLMQVSDADRGMIRGKVLILADDRSNKLVIVTQKPNMDFFDKVIEQLDVETTPDTVVKVYRLKYAEAEEVSDMINDLIGNSGSSRSSGKGNENRNAKQGGSSNITGSKTALNAPRKSANQRTGEAKAGELTKDNTTVLADKRINGLVVMTEKELVPTIESIIESMDIKLSQVLIETVIIEVTLGDGIQTGMDWVQKGRKQVTEEATDSIGRNLYYKQRQTTVAKNGTEVSSSTSYLSDLVPEGWAGGGTTTKTTTDEEGNTWTTTMTDSISSLAGTATRISHDGVANYVTAGTYTAIGGGQQGGIAANLASNLTSSAFNFIFDSDELGIKAMLHATKTDSHSKYIASPIIMTLDNKEATIDATQMRYLFKGYQYSGSAYSGSAVPDYEQKELGITIKVTPKINPNGTVMLTIEEEYSQPSGYQAIEGENGKTFNAQTTVTRKMSADALLENNQTVIFAGLTETSTMESESGIPILKDIPWIGKWLFGSVQRDEDRTELLVFMTPYVLDDAEAAQAEAIRRKRAVSDAHAWEDHGWSASKLAEPVSKKEQLRRLRDEFKKQDEERQAKIAIEKEKVERVKQLEKMSKEERKIWLEMHKEELKEEEKDELEKKMLDEDSQEDLKKLADDIKEKKLKEADKELDKAADEMVQDNEYNRLKRERAEKAKSKSEVDGQEATAEPQSGEAAEPEAVQPAAAPSAPDSAK